MPHFHLGTFGVVELTDARDRPVDAVLRQPKRLALLAYLAAKRPTPEESRDALVGLFWPDLDEAHARNALNKTLHFLRRHLAEDAVASVGRTRVRVDPERVRCDAPRFRSAVENGDMEEAMGLYLGDFLPGLSVTGAPGFLDWAERERRWYGERARSSALHLLALELSRGRVRSALEWAARLDRLDPHDEEVVRAVVRAHLRGGDRAQAIQRLERYEEWLREEFGEGVPADMVRLLQEEPAPYPSPEPSTSGTLDPPPELLEASRAACRVNTLEEYREFVDLLPDIAYRCDIRGSFPFVNRTLVETMGWSPEELRDRSYDELVREDFRDRVIDFYVRQVDERIPLTYLEFPALAKDGRELWVGQKVRLLTRDGEPYGIEAVTRDITTRVRRDAANRRTALEDRETRILNREAFYLLAQQRIRENRRAKEPFFTIHVQLVWTGEGERPGRSAAALAVRVVAGTLRADIRDSDAVGRLSELELVILVPEGRREAADAMRHRLEASVCAPAVTREVEGFDVRCEAVVHDPGKLRSADPLVVSAHVVEE